MFSPRQRQIEYRITPVNGATRHFPIVLDERGLMRGGPRPDHAAGSPEFMGQNCAACEQFHGRCMAEVALGDLIESFDDLQSTSTVHAEVRQEGRLVALEAPAPRVLASLMGLLMAASGCPRLIPFRAMALYHLPFATAEENAVRAAGFWLLRSRHDNPQDNPFAELQRAWDQLEEVNLHVNRKLLARTRNDAAANSIAYLDVLAKMGTMGLDSVLDALQPAFLARASGDLPSTSDSHSD